MNSRPSPGVMRLTAVHHRQNRDSHLFQCEIYDPAGNHLDLRYRVEPKIDGLVLDRADAFVLPCLLRAMKEGWNLQVDAPISERLAANLPDIAFILSVQLALIAPKAITCSSLLLATSNNKGAITGSDSSTASQRYGS